jgi:hypothetical protein
MKIEYASAGRSGSSAYGTIAQRTGLPVSQVRALAGEDRLGELFDRNGSLTGGAHAKLAHLEECRNSPARKRTSPHVALARLRALQKIWDVELGEQRSRDPQARLAEILGKAVPPWQGLV